jgi:hypothetical protein
VWNGTETLADSAHPRAGQCGFWGFKAGLQACDLGFKCGNLARLHFQRMLVLEAELAARMG